MIRWLALCAASLAACAFAQEVPNPPEPTPAFAGQTDAPPPRDASRYRVTTITEELAGPWSIACLPDGNFLIAESAGRMKYALALAAERI